MRGDLNPLVRSINMTEKVESSEIRTLSRFIEK